MQIYLRVNNKIVTLEWIVRLIGTFSFLDTSAQYKKFIEQKPNAIKMEPI
jgi:hypothetical protein